MRLKQYKKKTVGTYLSREIIFIVLALILSIILINRGSSKFNKVALSLAEAKTKKYISTVINRATEGVKFDGNLFSLDKSETNEIKMIKYDSYEATKLINEITNNIQGELDKLDNNEYYIVEEIPMGAIFSSALIRNIGPKIKIRIDIIGDALTELETSVKPYGINNALVEVTVLITSNARVIMPLNSEEIHIKNRIPISINIINGNIPEAYISTYK